MVQNRQGFRSTKPKQPRSPEVQNEREADTIKRKFVGSGYGTKRGVEELPEIDEPTPGNDSVNELYVRVLHKKILYTDETGQFHIRKKAATNM